MKFVGLTIFLFVVMTSASLRAQTPAPVVVQAATPGHAAVAAPPPVSNLAEPTHAIELLQQMETANAEMLKKQQATLATLDELQKAVQELKIFSKRG
jgi:hypothetical protein